MSSQFLDVNKPNIAIGEFGTLENEAIKKVLRESWQGEIKEKKQSKELINVLESHVKIMRNLLGSFDYESVCMKNVTTNAKLMRINELREYTKLLEALAVGYSYTYDKEMLWLLLSGLTQISRNARSTRRYLDLLLKKTGKKESVFSNRVDKARGNMDLLLRELKNNEVSLLRIFKKRKITVLKKRIYRMSEKVDRESQKAKRYSIMSRRIRDLANLGTQQFLKE